MKASANGPLKAPHINVSQVLREQPPLIDVRAPQEYHKGHTPGAINLPILDDEERRRVGIAYKQQGNAAATALGHKLVSGATKQERISAWAEQFRRHPDTCITCWRGGQRSSIAQSWLAECGLHIRRVEGGYKALRTACLGILEQARSSPTPWYVLAGRTGTGKTVILNQIDFSIDLEGAANHRGSAFGARLTPQPALATFENRLAYAWLQHSAQALLVEDESRTIGRLGLPESWHEKMQQAPLVLVDAEMGQRVEHIHTEYVIQAMDEGEAASALQARYLDALGRIRRRLGGQLHAELETLMKEAFAGHRDHREWIEALLTRYYDPMYDYQLGTKQHRIVFRGDKNAVTHYLQQLA